MNECHSLKDGGRGKGRQPAELALNAPFPEQIWYYQIGTPCVGSPHAPNGARIIAGPIPDLMVERVPSYFNERSHIAFA